METDKSKRRFILHDIFGGFLSLINDTAKSFIQGAEEAHSKSYFDSFDYCYPLIAEAGDMLLEEAEKRGIETRGKSKPEIARELYKSENK
ncbi:MAG: hypothetical protein ACQETR_11435 [Thermodesulfobacteriota bacterium]